MERESIRVKLDVALGILKEGTWYHEDGAGYYDKDFARENHDYVKVFHYENEL